MTYGRGSYRKKRNSGFNPCQQTVSKAVDAFLKNGGHITKIDERDLDYADFMTGKSQIGTADDFLMGV